jgi:ribosomal protein L30
MSDLTMSLNDFLDKKIVVTQVKSAAKLTVRQKASLIGLGLRGINTNSNLVASNSVLGMIRKVQHVVKFSQS